MSKSKRINEEIQERIQGRIDLGAKKYGDTISLEDKRDMVEEGLEECLDLAVYLACSLIQIQNKRHEKKPNSITTFDMTLIMEGLGKVILEGKDVKDYDKVNNAQQLVDRLTEYANRCWDVNKEKE
tara:strand:- start:18441 stop:18818 length:378 start_codon:yes stop_codon:yes gene_type:complete